MGHKPSSIRFLLMSVPYRKQLNFTFDGLTQAANSVERLRNFKLRLETSQFLRDRTTKIAEIAERHLRRNARRPRRRLEHRAGAGRDLRHGARRERRCRRRRGAQGRCAALLKVLEQFEEIFAVLKDDDAAKVARDGRVGEAGRFARQDQSRRRPNSQRRRRFPTKRSSNWSPNIRRRVRPATSRAPTQFARNWRRRASFSRTRKTACAGRGSKRSAGIPQKSNACSLLTVALLLRLAMNDAQGQLSQRACSAASRPISAVQRAN